MATAQDSFNDACKKGDLKSIKSLAKTRQIDIHANNESALQWASENGHLDIVKYLIEEHQADIHAGDEKPLRLAAENRHLDITLYLVDQGAEYNMLQNSGDVITSRIYDQIVEHVQEKERVRQQRLQEKQRAKQQKIQHKNIALVKNVPTRKAVRRRPLKV